MFCLKTSKKCASTGFVGSFSAQCTVFGVQAAAVRMLTLRVDYCHECEYKNKITWEVG